MSDSPRAEIIGVGLMGDIHARAIRSRGGAQLVPVVQAVRTEL